MNPGATIKKLKLDPSGKFVKVTFEAYVSVDALKDPTVSLLVGSSQIADDVKYKLISAKQSGNRVNIKVQITNQRAKPFDFMAMTLFKIYASGENVGEFNPFEGNNTVSFGLKKEKHLTANIVFDFKKVTASLLLLTDLSEINNSSASSANSFSLFSSKFSFVTTVTF